MTVNYSNFTKNNALLAGGAFYIQNAKSIFMNGTDFQSNDIIYSKDNSI